MVKDFVADYNETNKDNAEALKIVMDQITNS
jgi:hypothetical protein